MMPPPAHRSLDGGVSLNEHFQVNGHIHFNLSILLSAPLLASWAALGVGVAKAQAQAQLLIPLNGRALSCI